MFKNLDCDIDMSGRVSVGVMVGTLLVAGLGWLAAEAVSTTSCTLTGKARYELEMLVRAVETHHLAEDEPLPEQLAALTDTVYLETHDLEDPWDRDYVYRKNGPESFEIVSSGPDRKLGTRDDLAVHRSWRSSDATDSKMT